MSWFVYNNKKVFFKEYGSGVPLVVVHGNSVSSKMHTGFVKKLSKYFRVVSLDLPGHGKSERIEEWPIDFWYENGNVVAALLEYLELEGVVLLGYSGGAQIVLNVALEHPQRVAKVVADSFEGATSVGSFAENIFQDRGNDKKKLLAKLFWFLMHGRDWKDVVDNDSLVIYKHHKQIGRFFHKELSEVNVPLLLTGSRNDEYIKDFDTIYASICSKIPHAQVVLYDEGKHPASLTVGQPYIDAIVSFADDSPSV